MASFSEVGDSLGQWRGYCPNGAGYSIGFDARALWNEGVQQGFRTLAPCLYDQPSQQEVIGRALDRALASGLWARALEDTKDGRIFPGVNEVWRQEFLPVAPMIKHRAFNEECEWRLISQTLGMGNIWSGNGPIWHFRAGRSMLIPYVAVNLALINSHIPAKQIIVGPTPHMGLAIAAVSSMLMAEGMFDCPVENSKVPYRAW